MNRVKMLLIDCLFDLKTRVRDFYSEDFEALFNRPSHDLDEESVREVLFSLYEDGIVSFEIADDQQVPEPPVGSAQINGEWYVSLTTKGGQIWESEFHPNWDRYVSVDIDVCTTNEKAECGSISLQASSEHALNELLNELRTITKFEDKGKALALRPWNPTYWKSLEVGYEKTIVGDEKVVERLSAITAHNIWKGI